MNDSDDGPNPRTEASVATDETAGPPEAAATRVAPIAHADLTRNDLPRPREPFEEVVRFAYTFDGYERFGMHLCGEMANRAHRQYLEVGDLPAWLVGDLDRLRACLYFEARRWILLAREPDTRSLIYVHRLVDAIGAGIDAGAAGPTEGVPAR